MQVYGDGQLVPLAILDVDGQTIVIELWSGDDWAWPTAMRSLTRSASSIDRPRAFAGEPDARSP